MEISSAHHQAMATHQLDLGQCPKSSQHQQDMKTRPQPEQALRCPRCDSSNTKFCYYNNYSLTQPRYFCKGCRRYWTQGGSLRNVPVGGGCRKNKRSSSSSSSSSKKPRDPESQLITPTNSNPLDLTTLSPFSYDPNDLTLLLGNPNPNPNGAYNIPPGAGLLDILRNGFLDSTTTTTTATNGFHNFYYGYGGNEAESGVGGGEEMGLPYEGASSKGVDGGGESNVMMGLQPWQVSGDVDSGREYWVNGAGSSSWHGLINSSLM